MDELSGKCQKKAVCSTRYHSHGALSQENDHSRKADLLCIMAESPDLVAKALNRLNDKVFTDILTDRNRGSLSDLVYRFLCSAPDPSDADDSSKLAMNNDNTMNIHKNFALSESNSGVLDGFGILEEDWTLVHGAVVTCLYISCSLQSLHQPHLEITQECMKETEGESEEDGEHSDSGFSVRCGTSLVGVSVRKGGTVALLLGIFLSCLHVSGF